MSCAGLTTASLLRRTQEGNAHAFKGVPEEVAKNLNLPDDHPLNELMKNVRQFEE